MISKPIQHANQAIGHTKPQNCKNFSIYKKTCYQKKISKIKHGQARPYIHATNWHHNRYKRERLYRK